MGKIALYGTLSSAVGEPVVEASEVGGLEEALKPTRIKWMELKRLKDAKKLSPGHNYIITDYRLDKTREDIGIHGYMPAAFSIMVTALTTDSFSEDAKALPNEDSTYYANNNLSAWKIKYCFENDGSRFQWADVYYDAVIGGEKYSYAPEHNTTLDGVFYYAFAIGNRIVYSTERYPTENDAAYFLDGNTMDFYSNFQKNTTGGKGVIYYMRDEFGNEAPYDFKGIVFLRIKQDPFTPDTLHEEGFTFNNRDSYSDWSLTGKCFNNVIKPYVENGQQKLNHIVFEMRNALPYCSNNVFECNCYDMFIGGSCTDNKFGAGSHDITLTGCNARNIFEQNVSNIAIALYCESNRFHKWCENIMLKMDCSNNIFSNGCYELELEAYSSMNVFGMICHSIQLGSFCRLNRFGDNVSDVKFIYPSEDGSDLFPASYCCYNHFETNTRGLNFTYTYESRPTAGSWLQNVYVVGVDYESATVEVTTGYKDTIKISPNNNNNTASGGAWIDYGTSAPVPRRLDSSEEEMILMNEVKNGVAYTLWREVSTILEGINPMDLFKKLNIAIINGIERSIEGVSEASSSGIPHTQHIVYDMQTKTFYDKVLQSYGRYMYHLGWSDPLAYVSSIEERIPRSDTIFLFGGTKYIWDGTDLVSC